MTNTRASVPSLHRRLPDGMLSRLRLPAFILTWVIGWLVSVVNFRVHSGVLPNGAAEWWAVPMFGGWIYWPASVAKLVLDDVMTCFIPDIEDHTIAANIIFFACMLAYWPAYILLAVFAKRTGRLVYFTAVAVLTLAASWYWHWISIGSIGI
jgi:hypothetical protein